MSGSTSIGNDKRQGDEGIDAPPSDKSTLSPGDEALPGTVGTGENACRCCGGSGKMDDGTECKECSGTGKVNVAIGGA